MDARWAVRDFDQPDFDLGHLEIVTRRARDLVVVGVFVSDARAAVVHAADFESASAVDAAEFIEHSAAAGMRSLIRDGIERVAVDVGGQAQLVRLESLSVDEVIGLERDRAGAVAAHARILPLADQQPFLVAELRRLQRLEDVYRHYIDLERDRSRKPGSRRKVNEQPPVAPDFVRAAVHTWQRSSGPARTSARNVIVHAMELLGWSNTAVASVLPGRDGSLTPARASSLRKELRATKLGRAPIARAGWAIASLGRDLHVSESPEIRVSVNSETSS